MTMDKLYTVNQVANMLGVSKSTVERAISRGLLKVIWVSERKRAITESDLKAYLDGCNKQKTTGDVPVV